MEGSDLNAPITIDYSVLAAVLVVQLPLMLGFPIFLAFFLRRRLGTPIRFWLLGAAAFVASQVVHLPLNFALGLLGPARGVALLPLPVMGAIAGLSAGFCEETARYVAMRGFMKGETSPNSALQFGAGHGGIEAMLFGSLVLFGFINVLVAPAASSLGLDPDAAAALRHGARQYWATPWYLPALAGYERLCAIGVHIGLSTLVFRSVVRRRIGWYVAAMLVHALVDFPIVFMSRIGMIPIYVFLTLMAGALVATASWLTRNSEQAAHQPGST